MSEKDHLLIHEFAPAYLISGLQVIVDVKVSPQFNVPFAVHVDGPVFVYCTGNIKLLQVSPN